MSPSHRRDDDADAVEPSPAAEAAASPSPGPASGVTPVAPIEPDRPQPASDPVQAEVNSPDPHDIRAKYLPPGKAVGRIRVQPRGDSTGAARKPAPRKGRWWELPVLAIVAIAVAVIVKTFIVQPFYIPSGSMEKTLHGCPACNGDKILVNKPIFDVRSPHPGDIVVFSLPDAWPKTPGESPVAPSTNAITGPIRWFGQLVGVIPPDREDLVKRVIAVGGQTIKCCDARGRVQVSDTGPGGPFHALDEPFTYLHDPDGPEMTFAAVTVPHGRLWVMGDHRTNSADSRFHCVAGQESATASEGQPCDPVASTVPISNVIGKAFVIAWPPSRWRTLGTPHTFQAKALADTAAVTSGLPLAAGALAVLPLWFWRRRVRS
jgi:signal peptidase I